MVGNVGVDDGADEGDRVGADDGVGRFVEMAVGVNVGDVGPAVGVNDGDEVGKFVGAGVKVGTGVGMLVGTKVGGDVRDVDETPKEI